jgi:hypothetical protein
MRTKPILPAQIVLPDRIPLESGAVFVKLSTLDELEAFWFANRTRFAYAAQGLSYGDRQVFLNTCEWVFGPSKASVVSIVCRWDVMGIRCKWYDWAADDPQGHVNWFAERDRYRESSIARGGWSEGDEEEYQLDVKARTPETYRGWWTLENLPNGIRFNDWLGPFGKELFDMSLSVESAQALLQERTFDDWRESGADDIEFTDADGVDSIIAYWRSEQASGEDYYGSENEVDESAL